MELPKLDDIDLARRLAAGNHEAIELLVERHHSSVYRFLRQLTRHVEDSEDLAQLALLRAIKGASRYDGRSSMRAWLLGIAFHEFTRWRRRRLWIPLLADRPSPTNDYQRVIESEVLLDTISRLPENARVAFLLHHVEELPLSEIAVSLGIPEGTVKSRLHSARTRLSAMLEEEVSYATSPCQP